MALAGLVQGDTEIYREACRRMVQLVHDDSPDWLRNEVVWACVVAPDPGLSSTWLVETIQKSVTMATTTSDKALYINTLAAAQFRDGKYQESINSVKESMRLQNVVEDSMLMAMNHAKLDQLQQANEWLDKTKQHLSREAANEKWREGWRTRETQKLLLQEAESLIEQVRRGAD
jgi:hypothetical protein